MNSRRLLLATLSLLVGSHFVLRHSLVACQNVSSHQEEDEDEDYLRPDITAAEILRLRHFGADEYTVTTPDGYVLTITRGYNPLLAPVGSEWSAQNNSTRRQKLPVLFIHGIHNSGGVFVANTLNARPRDLSALDVGSMSLEELAGRLQGEPSAGSLPLLLMNCGHQVFLLNRRGNFESLGRTAAESDETTTTSRQSGVDIATLEANATVDVLQELATSGSAASGHADGAHSGSASNWTRSSAGWFSDRLAPISARPYINLLPGLFSYGEFARYVAKSHLEADFWNFTLDPQAQHDIPAAVDSILERTGAPKVGIVGHSVGGALALMSLSSVPSLGAKVSKAILWSPTFSLGRSQASLSETSGQSSQSSHQPGPDPLLYKAIPRDAVRQVACNSRRAQRVTCQSEFDQMYGWGGGQQPVTLSYLAVVNRSVSSGEVDQRAQFKQLLYPTKYDYLEPSRNRAAYGQPEAPVYNLTRISSVELVSLYAGCTDTVVPKENVTFTSLRLDSVPHKLTIVNGTNSAFNHVGYYLHTDRARQVIIPSLKDLASGP